MPFSPISATYACFAPFYEGQRIRIGNGATWSTADLVMLALEASLALGGKPVRCVGVVPGASMRVTTGSLRPFDDADKADILDVIWHQLRPLIIEWLGGPSASPPFAIGFTPGDNNRITLTWMLQEGSNPEPPSSMLTTTRVSLRPMPSSDVGAL